MALKSFFDMIHQKPQKMFLYGASCSPVTDQIAKAARHWNLVQVSEIRLWECSDRIFPHGRINAFNQGFWVRFTFESVLHMDCTG